MKFIPRHPDTDEMQGGSIEVIWKRNDVVIHREEWSANEMHTRKLSELNAFVVYQLFHIMREWPNALIKSWATR